MELVARIYLYLRQERTTAQRGSFSPTKMVIVSVFIIIIIIMTLFILRVFPSMCNFPILHNYTCRVY